MKHRLISSTFPYHSRLVTLLVSGCAVVGATGLRKPLRVVTHTSNEFLSSRNGTINHQSSSLRMNQ